MNQEPLLNPDNKRYSIFPIIHEDIWNSYLQHKKAIWFVNEINLTTDLKDWNNLNKDEQYFIKHILAFFATADGIVMENIDLRFGKEVQIIEAQFFYAFQNFIESEHSLMYSLLIETFAENKNEKNKLFNAIEEMPAIAKKAQWALKWISSDASFATRLLAFTIVEGLFFQGAFCSIAWLAERGIMPGLRMSNEYISRDEGLHSDFAILLYTKYIVNKLTQKEVEDIFREAVEIEKYFIMEALPCALLGMNSNMMSTYIECVADRLMKQLNYKPIYNAQNPFPHMERFCLTSHTNFFEARVTEYQKTVDISESTRKGINFDVENF